MLQTRPFLGRDAELKILRACLERLRARRGGFAFLKGATGAGKTRLAEEALSDCGLRLVHATCAETLRGPYAPLVQAFRNVMAESGNAALDAGPLAPALAAILPELGTPPQTPDGRAIREAALRVLLGLCRAEPAILFLDDLHWADDDTCAVLLDLAGRLGDSPLLVLATYRTDSLPRQHPLRRLRHDLRRRRLLQEIDVASFDKHHCRRLLQALLEAEPVDGLLDHIYERTGGLPLFIEEFVEFGKEHGLFRTSGDGARQGISREMPVPDSIGDMVRLRFDALGREAFDLLQCAAVAGASGELELLAQLGESGSALIELEDAGLLEKDARGGFRFRHPLVRDVVLREMSSTRRRELHARCAGWLAAHDAEPIRVAEHWARAGEARLAREAFLRAAENACAIHAYGTATAAAGRALENWPRTEDPERRADVLARLAHCAQLSGDLELAERTLHEAVDAVGGDTACKQAAPLLSSLATVQNLRGDNLKALGTHRRARKAFEAACQWADAAREAIACVGILCVRTQYGEAVEMAEKAKVYAGKAKDPELEIRAAGFAGVVHAMMGDDENSHAELSRALSMAQAHQMAELTNEIYRRMGMMHEYAARFDDACATYMEVIEREREAGRLDMTRDCLGCLAWALYRSGDWKRAREVCAQALDLEGATVYSVLIANCVLALTDAWQGNQRSAQRHVRKASAMVAQNDWQLFDLFMHLVLALIEDLGGREPEATSHYRRAIDLWQTSEDRHDALHGFFNAACYFAAVKDAGNLARTIDALRVIADDTRNEEALGCLNLALAEAALLRDDREEAREQYRRALEAYTALNTPLETARVEFRIGQLAKREGNADEALDHLHRAHRRLANLGARTMEQAAARYIAELGDSTAGRKKASRQAAPGDAPLTRRQKDVLALMAEGLTNKEIAAKLFLSPRTVEMHAAAVLDRLGCRSRAEATRIAAERNLL